MRRKRRNHSAGFKDKVALVALYSRMTPHLLAYHPPDHRLQHRPHRAVVQPLLNLAQIATAMPGRFRFYERFLMQLREVN